MRRFLLTLLVLVGVAGCVTQGTQPGASAITSAPAGKSQIIINRSTDMLYVAAAARVDINGMRAASLWRGETFNTIVEPGQLTISTDAWSAPGRTAIRFNVEPNKSYAVEIAPNAGAMWSGAAFGLVGQAIEGNGPFQLVVRDVKAIN